MAGNQKSLADQAVGSPRETLTVAEKLLANPATVGDVRIDAQRAQGLAERDLGQLPAAEQSLRSALSQAQDEYSDLAAPCALSLGSVLVFQGRVEEALDLFKTCAANSTGLPRADAQFQLGTAYARLGQFDKTLKLYNKALPVFRRHGQTEWQAHLLLNRGALHLDVGRYKAAHRDLDGAIGLLDETTAGAQLARAIWNKAEADYLTGNLQDALIGFARAEDLFVAHDVPREVLFSKAHALLAAGLFAEARDICKRAFDFHREAGNTFEQLDALVPAAHAAFALGQDAEAVSIAEHGEKISGSEAFPLRLIRLRNVRLSALARAGQATDKDLDDARTFASSMRRGYGIDRAMASAIAAASVAISLTRHDTAAVILEDVRRLAPKGSAHLQIERWTLLTEVRISGADPKSPYRAITAALAAFEQLMDSTSSYEIRVTASRHLERLIEAATALAIEGGRLRWLVETAARVRAAAIAAPQAQLTRNAPLRNALEQLATAEALLSQNQEPPTPVHELQRRVAELSRTAGRAGAANRGSAPSPLLAGEAYVTFSNAADQLVATSQTANGYTVRSCGATSLVTELVDQQGFLARQLARRQRLTARAVNSLLEQHQQVSAELGALLFGELNHDRVIISATPALNSVSWGALPQLLTLPHVVAPSIALARRPLPRTIKSTSILGSTQLAHVPREVDDVARRYGTSAQIGPSQAQLGALLDVDLLHAAAHFSANGLDPLHSALDLGTVRIHGYQVLSGVAPRVAVLSACGSGLSESVGVGQLGFATALLAAGSASVVASHSVVEDGNTVATLMARLHDHISSGAGPAEALAALRGDLGPADLPLAGSFVTQGAGW